MTTINPQRWEQSRGIIRTDLTNTLMKLFSSPQQHNLFQEVEGSNQKFVGVCTVLIRVYVSFEKFST